MCRVYLEQAMRDAYEDYVEHEELMRGELLRVSGPLFWKAAALISTQRGGFALSPQEARTREG
jgi:hypothetical protein